MLKYEPFISTQTSYVQQFRAAALRRCLDTVLLALLVCASPVHIVFADVCSVPSFASARTFDVGGYPGGVAVGDFNGDGKPDLAIANQGSYDASTQTYTNTGVSVLIGNGDGTFQTAVNYAAGKNPAFVVVGDFKGDGKPDLAVVNQGPYDSTTQTYTNSGISVLIGKRDGTFQTAVNYGVGTNHVSVGVGDFNGDGKADLAVVNEGSWDSNDLNYLNSSISVLLSKGDGTFQNAVNYRAGAHPVAVALGDFNGDGKPDLVVANAGDNSGNLGNLSVLLGKGDGTFQTAVGYGIAGYRPFSVAVGDFNGDGKLDLAVANFQSDFSPGGSNVGTISVLLGKGDGTFQKAVGLPLGNPWTPTSVAVADFNGDGISDLAVGHGGPLGLLALLLGNGDGTFQPFSLNVRSDFFVAVGDFNNDGKPDLVAPTGRISVLLNAGVSSSSTPRLTATGEFHVYGYGGSAAVGDFNGDGKPDLAVANYKFSDSDANRVGVSILFGKGDGTFQSAVSYDTGGGASSLAVGDFNGDGKADLAAVLNFNRFDSTSGSLVRSVSVLLGKGNSAFQPAVSYEVVGSGSLSVPIIATGDLNGDGKPDLVVVGKGISLLLGKGDGTFQAAVTLEPVGNHSQLEQVSVVPGDFNGDGKLDFVTTYVNGQYSGAVVWLNISCAAAPNLTMARSGATVAVSWPFRSAGYVLESSTSLNPANWRPAETLPVNNNGQWEVTTPITQRQGYFRLRKP